MALSTAVNSETVMSQGPGCSAMINQS